MANLSGSQFPLLVKLEVAPVTTSNTSLVGTYYDWVVFTNSGTIAAQTVTLPATPFDGQMILISNFAAITALTLSPAVTGAPAGLTAGQGLWIAWSAAQAVWFVVN